ncbi:MAG: hypothetical protein Tsb009_18150 [Planctomycetaceae bacterium]
MNNNLFVSVSVGVGLLSFGVWLLRSHIQTWRAQKNDPTLEDRERLHLYARYRRRMQASGIIVLLGVLIPMGDILFSVILPRNLAPVWFALYWGVVLLLALWIILLALGDMYSTSVHTKASLSRIRSKQRELEKQISEIQRRKSNGQHRKNN